MSMKNSIDTIWNRTSDLPICSTAPYNYCATAVTPLNVVHIYVHQTGQKQCVVIAFRRLCRNFSKKKTLTSVVIVWQIVVGFRIMGASRSHSDAPQLVGLLWMSDQPVAENCTWQHTTKIRERYPCRWRYSNPQPQRTSDRRPTP